MDKKFIRARMFPREEHDFDFESYVSQLIDAGTLEGTAVIGIAKQILLKGVESLSSSQINTFIEFGLLKSNYVESCERCAFEIPWSEMFFALDDEYCSYCRHLIEKDKIIFYH
ncbi:MAG: hypothetical protein ACQEWF_01775 [Bacillota bacterium]